ncbi:hypothetical protein Tco_0551507 [Tanacetum coccineum]
MLDTQTSSQKALTSSLDHFDTITRICDAVSTHCMPNLDHLHVELQSCPVSSQIETRWVDGELPSQWYQRTMYLLHVSLRTFQDELRVAQDELVQVNVKRGRVAFFNKMLMLLVLAMFLIRFM